MIKVADVVLDLLTQDEIASEAARAGLLNLSAYAEKIHKKVENSSYKDVQKGTIVVALSRIVKKLSKAPSLLADVAVTNLDMRSSLCALTYEKTADTQRRIAVLHPFNIAVQEIFCMSEGPTKTTIICIDNAREKIKKHMQIKPLAELDNLVGVTVKIRESDTKMPNILFTFLNSFASKRISVVDVLSTYDEISFIVNKKDMDTVFQSLHTFFASNEK